MNTIKQVIALLALACLSAAAHAECLPSTVGGAGGALKTAAQPSGAVIYAWRCPAGDAQFIVAPVEWQPKLPADAAAMKVELARLAQMYAYSGDPGYLRDAAIALLATN